MSTNKTEAAQIRVEHSMSRLKALLGKQGLTLDVLAEAVINADVLLSALSLLYDAVYECSTSTGIIGLTPQYPVTRRK